MMLFSILFSLFFINAQADSNFSTDTLAQDQEAPSKIQVVLDITRKEKHVSVYENGELIHKSVRPRPRPEVWPPSIEEATLEDVAWEGEFENEESSLAPETSVRPRPRPEGLGSVSLVPETSVRPRPRPEGLGSVSLVPETSVRPRPRPEGLDSVSLAPKTSIRPRPRPL